VGRHNLRVLGNLLVEDFLRKVGISQARREGKKTLTTVSAGIAFGRYMANTTPSALIAIRGTLSVQ
jgi:hypothetical protein